MNKPHKEQLTIALFAFIGLCFFHCNGAVAAVHYSATQPLKLPLHQHNIEDTQFASYDINGTNLDLSKWTQGSFTLTEIFELNRIALLHSETLKAFPIIAAREFIIRTGLSPPRLFA